MPRVRVDDAEDFLVNYGMDVKETSKKDEKLVLCPFHEDHEPSCQVNVDKQVFTCPSCGAGGDVIDLVAGFMGTKRAVILAHVESQQGRGDEPINMALVTGWHNVLLQNKAALDTMRERKGVFGKTVKAFMLGLDGDRYTIPVLDRAGKCVNVRKWSPTDKNRKVINIKGRGGGRLFPIQAMEQESVIVTEGELKAILLHQHGFNGVTQTGGARTWHPEFNSEFANKVVYIAYDVDDAGKNGAQKVARNLFGIAKTVRICKIPLDPKEHPKGDVTDFFVKAGGTVEGFTRILEEAEEWKPAPLQQEFSDDDTEIHKVPLHRTSEAGLYHKFVQTDAVVSAKDTAPYIIPLKAKVMCTKDKDFCHLCPVYNQPGESVEVTVSPKHPAILGLVDIPSDRVAMALKVVAGIPKKCEVCRFRIEETQNVEEIRLIPSISIKADEGDVHVVRRAFYVGHGLESNSPYVFTARVVPEPKTQYATLLAYGAKAAVDSLSTYKLDDPEPLRIFRPKEWTVESLKEKLDDLYGDLEANVTRIYHRRDLHLFYDLVYHSVLYLPFQGRQVRGWMEGLVLGDSGQGKSETLKNLMAHYGVGEKIDAKGASVAGLLGGMQETAKRWFVTWGVIPLNDRRLVALEEVKGMATATIERLTDMRSSGIADLSKIEKARTNARTRLLWISNPRSDQQLASYNFGIYAIKELIGALEDVRRFDMAIMVASGDVAKEILNMREGQRPTAEHRHTSEKCRSLILWSWSRKEAQTVVEPDAIEQILKSADEMGDRYVSNIPLVEAADQRHKLLRLAAALAARTFSSDESGEKVIVRKCHAEYVHQFLDRVYSSPVFGYLEYSKLIKGESSLRDGKEIEGLVRSLPNARDVVRSLLEWTGFSITDWIDVTEHDKDTARMAIGTLVRKNAIRRGRGGLYFKLPAFIAMLREIEIGGQLSTDSLSDQVMKGDI